MFTLHVKTLAGDTLVFEQDQPTSVRVIRRQLADELHVSPILLRLYSLETEHVLCDEEVLSADAFWMALVTYVFDQVTVERGIEWKVIDDRAMMLTPKRMVHYVCTIETAEGCPLPLCFQYEFFQEVTSGLYYDAIMMDFWGTDVDTCEYLLCDTDEEMEDMGVYVSAAWEDLIRAHLVEDAYDSVHSSYSDACRSYLDAEREHIIELVAEKMQAPVPVQRTCVMRQISPYRTGRLVKNGGVWEVQRV